MYQALENKVICQVKKGESVTASGIITKDNDVTYTVTDAIDYTDLIGKNIKLRNPQRLDGNYISVEIHDILGVYEQAK